MATLDSHHLHSGSWETVGHQQIELRQRQSIEVAILLTPCPDVADMMCWSDSPKCVEEARVALQCFNHWWLSRLQTYLDKTDKPLRSARRFRGLQERPLPLQAMALALDNLGSLTSWNPGPFPESLEPKVQETVWSWYSAHGESKLGNPKYLWIFMDGLAIYTLKKCLKMTENWTHAQTSYLLLHIASAAAPPAHVAPVCAARAKSSGSREGWRPGPVRCRSFTANCLKKKIPGGYHNIYIYISIYLSIYPSIYRSIHPSFLPTYLPS